MVNMTPEEIHKLRETWKDFVSSKYEGRLSSVSIEVLKELAEQMDKAIDVLSIFPEAETTRYWFCLQRADIQGIIHFREKHV
jgi:hypothetical protein